MAIGEFSTGVSLSPAVVRDPTIEELNGIENEISISFPVLNEAIRDLMRRFMSSRREDLYQTTPIEITLPDSEDAVVVFAGYAANESLADHVIYVQDRETGLFRPLIAISARERTIYDGERNEKNENEHRAAVRFIIDAMNEKYETEAKETADQDLGEYVRETLGVKAEQIKAKIAELTEELTTINESTPEGVLPAKKRFHVRLNSGWAHDGEESLDEVYDGENLSEIIQKATTDFKAMNRRSDVQASIVVSIVLGEGTEVELPKHVVQPVFQSLAVHQGQATEIQVQKNNLKKFPKD